MNAYKENQKIRKGGRRAAFLFQEVENAVYPIYRRTKNCREQRRFS